MNKITLTEQHTVKPSHPAYNELKEVCIASKKVYNCANYLVRQTFFQTKMYKHSLPILDSTIKKDEESSQHYYRLPTKVSQQTLKLLDQSWKSFHGITKWYYKQKEKGVQVNKPSFPKYVKKDLYMAQYTIQSISKKFFDKEGVIKLSKIENLKIKSPNIKKFLDIKVVRIIPKNNRFIVEVIYEKEVKENPKLRKGRVLGIDIGLSNLATCVSNVGDPFIINGKPAKSINQFYNKKKARLQSQLPNKQSWSNKLSQLTNKRNNKIKDYLHNSSREIISYCLTNNIGRIIIGHNKGWKQNIKLGKKTNQNFVSIPFNTFISMIEYKALLEGIEVIIQEEAHTSKCSFIDHEQIRHHKKYSGKRVHRGMFKTKEGILINADVNGAYNIVEKWRRKTKKVVPNFQPWKDGIEGFVVSPLRKTVDFN